MANYHAPAIRNEPRCPKCGAMMGTWGSEVAVEVRLHPMSLQHYRSGKWSPTEPTVRVSICSRCNEVLEERVTLREAA